MRLAFSAGGCIASLMVYHYHVRSQASFGSSGYRMLGFDPSPPLRGKRCVIVGAGLEGVTTAYFLRERGWDVTVLDAAPGPGQHTSYANAVRSKVKWFREQEEAGGSRGILAGLPIV